MTKMISREKITPSTARTEEEIFTDLESLCAEPGYIHAIAYFCWRDNLVFYSGSNLTEADLQPRNPQEQLLRTEISTLIGLLIRNNLDVDLPTPKRLQDYIDRSELLLYEMHMSLQKPWMAAFQEIARRPEKAKSIDPFSTAESFREPIFYGGESAYNFQYTELSRRKYKADQEWMQSNKGFSIDQASQVAEAICKLQIEKINHSRVTLAATHPDQWNLLDPYLLQPSEIAERTSIALEVIENFLAAFSVPEKSNSIFSSLSEFNETNSSPILRLNDGKYVLFQQYSLLEAMYETPFFWMMTDAKYKDRASQNRGAFSEIFLRDRLSSIFGPEHVFVNVDIYKGKHRFAEADLLVLFGDQVIIFQAKSKRLTIEARKGNDLQLKADFKKAIQDAYDQSVQCSRALLDEGYRFVLASGKELVFGGKPRKIFPICVVSDHYPALASQARQFLKQKETAEIKRPVVTDLFFIDTLTEILNSPLQFLNYLALRARFDRQVLVSQELVVLGYHLKYNLWLKEEYDFVNLGDDFTSSIDLTMLVRRTGVEGPRVPEGILTRFNGTPIGTLLAQIESSATPELVGLGMLLLQLGSETAAHINSGLREMVRSAGTSGIHHDFSLPAEHEKSGFTIHANNLPRAEARERLAAHCALRKYATESDSWYGLRLSLPNGEILDALVVIGKWERDSNMEKALAMWQRKPMVPTSALSRSMRKRTVGRNDLCPCGSGLKYKKCCLEKQNLRGEIPGAY